jgi:hypothetical protein
MRVQLPMAQMMHQWRLVSDLPIAILPFDEAITMVFKLVEGAQKNWRRIDGHNQLPKLIQGVRFTDGIEAIGNSAAPQAQAAA